MNNIASPPLPDQLTALVPRLRRFARALTASREEAEDLVQDALERALSRLDQWQPGTRLDSWMYRIIQNLRRSQVRSPALRKRGEMPPDDQIAGVDGAGEAEGRLFLRDVRRAFGQLPADQRAVLTLVCVDGLAYREAAEVLDIPIGTVMSRLARARMELHRLVGGSGGGSVVLPMKFP